MSSLLAQSTLFVLRFVYIYLCLVGLYPFSYTCCSESLYIDFLVLFVIFHIVLVSDVRSFGTLWEHQFSTFIFSYVSVNAQF